MAVTKCPPIGTREKIATIALDRAVVGPQGRRRITDSLVAAVTAGILSTMTAMTTTNTTRTAEHTAITTTTTATTTTTTAATTTAQHTQHALTTETSLDVILKSRAGCCVE